MFVYCLEVIHLIHFISSSLLPLFSSFGTCSSSCSCVFSVPSEMIPGLISHVNSALFPGFEFFHKYLSVKKTGKILK